MIRASVFHIFGNRKSHVRARNDIDDQFRRYENGAIRGRFVHFNQDIGSWLLLSEQEARQHLASAVDGRFCVELKRVLKTYRAQSWLSIDQAADLSGLSVRSLQRRLGKEGIDFSQLVDRARWELAVELFEDSRISLKEIAGELGYSSLPNFSRAFKRWTGKSPSSFRRQPPE